jgi:twinkle protein
MGNTLFGLLADRGIKLRNLHAGHTEHILCPQCGGGKTREHSLAVTIDTNGQGAVWMCHRANCNWSDWTSICPDRPTKRERKEEHQPLTEVMPWEHMEESEWFWRFWSDRKIGFKTVDAIGVYPMASHRFPDPVGVRPAIVFPYRHKGRLIHRKYRPDNAKNPQTTEVGGSPTLFNIDAIDGAETIYIVEGEPDVLAMHECLYPATVTLRDGAGHGDKRFAALGTHEEELRNVAKIVLAGDMDEPGLAMREELARRLGRHRCWLVTWPEGCKDACDALRDHGLHAVRDAVESAVRYPIEDVVSPDGEMLKAIRDKPIPPTMGIGTFSTDQLIRFPTEGRLITVTGYAAHGKSSWTRDVLLRAAQKHDRRLAIFTPEHNPPDEYIRDCVTWLIGRQFDNRLSDAEAEKIGEWMNGRVTIMARDPIKQPPTLEWIIETATAIVMRDGATDLLIDPWNEIMHTRGELTESDYVGRSLQVLKAFALHHGCNVWVCAHPPKPPPTRNGEERKKIDGYDIAGSAHWANKSDVGVTVWSDTEGTTEIIVWKSRFRRWSKAGSVSLEYDPETGRYRDPQIDREPPPSQKHWSDN